MPKHFALISRWLKRRKKKKYRRKMTNSLMRVTKCYPVPPHSRACTYVRNRGCGACSKSESKFSIFSFHKNTLEKPESRFKIPIFPIFLQEKQEKWWKFAISPIFWPQKYQYLTYLFAGPPVGTLVHLSPNIWCMHLYAKRLGHFEKPAVSYISACTWMGGNRVIGRIGIVQFIATHHCT